MELTLVRLSPKNSPQKGVLLFNDEPLLVTLELPWNDNKNNVSCIPCGEYNCMRTANRVTNSGMKLNVTYVVSDVVARSGILFHPGNSIKDTSGCVLLAERYGDDFQIKESTMGFQKFINYLQGADFFPISIIAPLW